MAKTKAKKKTTRPGTVIKRGRKYYRYRTSFGTKAKAKEFARRARKRGYGVVVRKRTIRVYQVFTRG